MADMPTLRFARLDPQAKLPERKHPGDAGVDIYANETVTLAPFSAVRVHTGLTFEIRSDFMLLAKPKSGSDFLLGAGVIDPGYQGEILIKVINYMPTPLVVNRGSALAQLVQVAIFTDPLKETTSAELHALQTDRGADGGIARQEQSIKKE
jgi:dUTP pyrophosphatase